MDAARVSALLTQAAEHFGLDVSRAVPLGGMTGQVFALDDVVLRVGWPGVLDLEAVAATAAAAVVPVPAVLGRYDGDDGSVVLLPRIDAPPAAVLTGLDPARARRRGEACGRVQLALGEVPAPAALAVVGPADGGARLLHLDLHPLNVLVDPDGAVVAVLDWTNAAAGPADYDRARTATILTLDPVALALRSDPAWVAFVDGWIAAAALDDLPPEATAWACRYMLADLAGRYTAQELAHVQGALDVALRADPDAAVDAG